MIKKVSRSHANTGTVGSNDQIRRRELLTFAVGLVLSATGCTSSTVKSSSPSERSVVASPPEEAPSPSPTPSVAKSPSSVAMPHVQLWRPSSADIEPQAKLQAVRVIEAIGTWSVGGSGLAATEARIAALGEAGVLARETPSLRGDADRAVVGVIDAQYGGILTDRASVLVACRQWRVRGGVLTPGGTTVDVRLSRVGSQWRITALHPANPGPPASTPSSLSARILRHPRIELTPASAADVRAGRVHRSVLNALLTLATDYSIGVSVIRSGHPIYVFGTKRLSDHPRGRAFDTWRIDGHAVVDPATPKKLITDYMQAAAAVGSYNVGGPYLLPGSGNQFFSDATHHDHVHAGFLH